MLFKSVFLVLILRFFRFIWLGYDDFSNGLLMGELVLYKSAWDIVADRLCSSNSEP